MTRVIKVKVYQWFQIQTERKSFLPVSFTLEPIILRRIIGSKVKLKFNDTFVRNLATLRELASKIKVGSRKGCLIS